jgi:anti-sigma B factor antagonist
MEYRIDHSQGVTVMYIAGEIDVSQALELREVLGGLVRDATSRVVVDLSGVPFVDSSGVGILVTAHRRAAESGGSFAVAAVTTPVGQVFSMTRTEKLLHLYRRLIMQVTVERAGGVAVVAVAGDVDAGSSGQLRAQLEALLGEGLQNFVIDLSETGFLDSSGLATLVHTFKRVRIGNGDVRLAALQPQVNSLFALTRLDRVFEIFGDRASAVRSFETVAQH